MVIYKSGPGGSISEGVRDFLQGGGQVGVSVCGGDVGPHPEDGAGNGQFSKQVCRKDHQEAAMAPMYGWDLGIPASGGGTEGSGVRGDKEVGHKDT